MYIILLENIDFLKVFNNLIISYQLKNDVQTVSPINNVQSGDKIRSDGIFKSKNTEQAQKDSNSEFSSISSPFFFLCHHPRPGEPKTKSNQDKLQAKDVSLTVSVAGDKKLDLGYEPNTVYECE